MLLEAKNSELVTQWHQYIESPQAQDAYCYLVGRAAALSEFNCHAQFKGEVRSFVFLNDNSEQPFAFIPNKHWLLFYFRGPAVQSGNYSLRVLQGAFDSASENNEGEWTIRLRSILDVQRLWAILSIA